MSFTRVKPLGWALFELLTSGQMNQLDIDHANALDAAAGGTYAPTGDITLSGANGGRLLLTSGNFLTLTNSTLSTAGSGTANFNGSGGLTTGAACPATFAGTTAFNNTNTFTGTVAFNHANYPTLSSRTVTRAIAHHIDGSSNPAKWSVGYASGVTDPCLKQIATDSLDHVDIIIPNVIDGATLASVSMYRKASATVSMVTAATAEVLRVNAGGTVTSLRSTGPTADGTMAGAYNTEQPLTVIPDQNALIDTGTYNYFLRITGASTGGGTPSLFFYRFRAAYTVTQLPR